VVLNPKLRPGLHQRRNRQTGLGGSPDGGMSRTRRLISWSSECAPRSRRINHTLNILSPAAQRVPIG